MSLGQRPISERARDVVGVFFLFVRRTWPGSDLSEDEMRDASPELALQLLPRLLQERERRVSGGANAIELGEDQLDAATWQYHLCVQERIEDACGVRMRIHALFRG